MFQPIENIILPTKFTWERGGSYPLTNIKYTDIKGFTFCAYMRSITTEKQNIFAPRKDFKEEKKSVSKIKIYLLDQDTEELKVQYEKLCKLVKKAKELYDMDEGNMNIITLKTTEKTIIYGGEIPENEYLKDDDLILCKFFVSGIQCLTFKEKKYVKPIIEKIVFIQVKYGCLEDDFECMEL